MITYKRYDDTENNIYVFYQVDQDKGTAYAVGFNNNTIMSSLLQISEMEEEITSCSKEEYDEAIDEAHKLMLIAGSRPPYIPPTR